MPRGFYDGALMHALLHVRTNVRLSENQQSFIHIKQNREASSPAKAGEQMQKHTDPPLPQFRGKTNAGWDL